MGQHIVLFHSALGLRPAVRDFAARLRQAGHTAVTPDLYDGEVFTDYADGTRKRDALTIQGLIQRAQAAVLDVPADAVFAGFSMGAGAAEFLAATRPGARAAILMHGALAPDAFGLPGWPVVPVQMHHAKTDPWVDAAAVQALEAAVQKSGAPVEVHSYEKGGHLFADPDLPDHDADSARLMFERVLGLLGRL